MIALGEMNGLPAFAQLQHIWVTKERLAAEILQHIYFGLSMYETLGFDEAVLAYTIREPLVAQGMELVFIENIFVPSHSIFTKARKSHLLLYHMI